jgi:hypothetical protein
LSPIEKPVMPLAARVSAGDDLERKLGLTEDDAEDRVDAATDNGGDGAPRVHLPAAAVDEGHAAEELVEAEVGLVLVRLPFGRLLLREIAREAAARVGTPERDLVLCRFCAETSFA